MLIRRSIAKPIDNGSPVKYFEVIVSINGGTLGYWRPDSQLPATIYVAELEGVISIPTQSIISESGKYFVMVENGNDWEKREVEIGRRSSAKTQIITGLKSDDMIALLSINNRLNNQGDKNAVL